jgi:hypothetical protein
MEIGEPRRVYTIEPVDDPVPREAPLPEPTPDEPAVVPSEPEEILA